MFEIKYDNKNQYEGNDTWFDRKVFDTYVDAEEYLLNKDYMKLEQGVYEEINHCPMIAYIEEVK